VIALTFDDGPNATATPRILDVLAERGVPATFFVLGSRAREHPELIARMLEAGHAVQPHCWESHQSHLEQSRADLEEDAARTLATLDGLGCPRPVLWRPPYGDVKDPDSYEAAAAHALQIVVWPLETCDWSDEHSVERILADIDSEARDDARLRADSVILMHDTPKTERLLRDLLDRIESRAHDVGLLARDNAAVVRGGPYRSGRPDRGRPSGTTISPNA